MSQMFMPPPAEAPAPGGEENPLVAAMGAGPGGADTASLPPELMAALGGGAPGAPPGAPGGEEMEPASLEAAMEHFRMGIQMLQELQVSSTDDMEMSELHGLMGPVQKMLADRQKNEQMAAASKPGGGALGG